MAATIRQWEAVVDLLGRLSGSYAADDRHVSDLQRLLELGKTQPPAPRAVWKKLVQQKVPLRLLKACAQHLHILDGPSLAATAAACGASKFFSAAVAAGAVHTHEDQTLSGSSRGGGGQGAAGDARSSTASASTGSALSASLLLQLQQSGLLEQLPAALSAATQQLQRLVATGEAGRGAAGSDEVLHYMVVQLLQLAATIVVLPEHNSGVDLVPLRAVAGLVLSSLRYLTCVAAAEAAGQQRQQRAWQPQITSLKKWLRSVSRAMQLLLVHTTFVLNTVTDRSLLSGSVHSSSSGALPQATAAADAAVEQVLCSEEYLLCLAVWTIGLALPLAATPTHQQLESGGSSGTGSSGSGGSSGVGKASRQAGQQLQEQGAGCLPSPLPMQVMAVLQQAGCSADVAVGMAQQVAQGTASLRSDNATKVWFAFAEAQRVVPGLLQGRQQQQLGRFALLHKLMCAALLQLAHMFATLDLPQLRCCSKGCVAAFTVLQQAQHLEHLQAQSSNGSDSGNSSSPDQRTSEQQQLAIVHSSCLQSAQDLLQHLLQLWGSATTVLTAADAPVGLRLPGSSSSGGSSSGGAADQAAVLAVLQGADGPIVLRCISSTINVLSASLLPLLFESRGSAQGANAGEQDVLAVARLCSLLSQQTRASIEAVQASGSISTVALRQSEQLLASTLQAAAADLLHAVQVVSIHSNTREPLIKAAGVSCDSYGSPEQRYLFDLLCSLLKLCSIDSDLLPEQPGCDLAGRLSMVFHVALVAMNCVSREAKCIKDCSTAAQAATTAAVTVSGAAAAAPAAEQDTAAAAAAAQGSVTCCPSPTAMLPWLVLLGRCCLLWARWLQQLSVAEVTAADSAQEQLADQRAGQVINSTWDVTRTAAAAAADPESLLPGQCYLKSTSASKLHCVAAGYGGTMGLSAVIHDTAASASMWLEAGSNMQLLADLGYNLEQLQEALMQLRAAAAAIHHLTQELQTNAERAAAEAISNAERTSLIGLCPQLQVVGQALTAFAIKIACNNPGCLNASGLSEARLVTGKSCVCGGCLTARYCSRACLKQHWKVHKPVCQALAATAAAGSQACAAAVNTQHASG